MTGEYEILLADGWTEEFFERGMYGTEDTPGVGRDLGLLFEADIIESGPDGQHKISSSSTRES